MIDLYINEVGNNERPQTWQEPRNEERNIITMPHTDDRPATDENRPDLFEMARSIYDRAYSRRHIRRSSSIL